MFFIESKSWYRCHLVTSGNQFFDEHFEHQEMTWVGKRKQHKNFVAINEAGSSQRNQEEFQ